MLNHLSIWLRFATAASLSLWAATAHAQGRVTTLAATRVDGDLRTADQVIDTMIRERALVVRDVQRDPLLPDRVHERLDQYVRGVRIVGGDVTRQTAPDGTVSVFGTLHSDLTMDLTPRIASAEARGAVERAVAGPATGPDPELVILPLSDGYHLAYLGQAIVGLEILNVFVDANSGGLLQKFSEFISEIGKGAGTYGDLKKVSARSVSGTFVADDTLRPADITTYDMQGNLARLTAILNVQTGVAASDIASDADNDWTDPTVVDAHVYSGWYYDYLVKRLGRSGTDNRDLRMAVFTHPVRIADIGSASSSIIGTYYLNAFHCGTCGPGGRGAVVFGEGAPRGTFYTNLDIKPFAASLDVVAHELTHAVTANSARLNGFPFSEAGALNEAFSDMFGVATAFFYEPLGNGPLQASYLQGKDLSVPAGAFGRSLSNPALTGDPDHYLLRFIGGDPHYNSTIASHAFYLAIEGGVNRTSGLSVQGVGAGNREQIEKSFFRALTSLMPSSSTFALTRVATIQAARDLYGAGGTVERAITQAWSAVGVQERTLPTAALLPNPAVPDTTSCTGAATPHWLLGVTASAGASNVRITQWAFDFYNHTGALQDHDVLTAANFAQAFTQCGPGSSTMLAQTDACTAFCVDLRGDTTGAAQIIFNGIDDAGRPIVFSTPR
ncbi:MAG: M4 family metallopeptidase, partial [Vicinamibacterales bacterium]